MAKNDGASPFWLSPVTEPNYPLDPTQNYNRKWAFLKIPPLGRKRGPLARDSAAKSSKKGKTVMKKGGKKCCCPPKLLPLLNVKFDVDYDTAIKHDLILIFDIVMGV